MTKNIVKSNSDVCKNCICIAMCLNRPTDVIVHECAILSNRILDFCNAFPGRGDRTIVHLIDLDRDVRLEIYTDSVYFMEESSDDLHVISVIDRKYKYVLASKS